MSGTEVTSAVDTPRPQTKNFADPDETLTLTKGSAATVRIGELVVGRLVLEPGYRYSEHTGPTAGTASCQFHHIGLGISGAARFRMDDGTEFDVRAGDVFDERHPMEFLRRPSQMSVRIPRVGPHSLRRTGSRPRA